MSKLNCIMLVEDDDSVNFYNEFLLQDLEVVENIVIRENGEEALRYLESCVQDSSMPVPELIFLDINMPVMNGFEFLEKYDNHPLKETIKALVVMLTTSLHPNDLERANAFACVSEYVYKPLMEERIEEILSKYFN